MMQSCASAAKLLGGGPILESGVRVTPPRIIIGSRRCFRQFPRARLLPIPSHAARNTTPAGISPVVTRRHRAISNLRARATIIVLRFLPALSVRVRYHWLNALSFWKSKKRQASWIIPRRTRALPALASPFSRLLLPLSSGASETRVARHRSARPGKLSPDRNVFPARPRAARSKHAHSGPRSSLENQSQPAFARLFLSRGNFVGHQ
jgi:hypothetical protein